MLDDERGQGAVCLFHQKSAGGLPWTVSAAFGPPGAHRFRLTVLGVGLRTMAIALRDRVRKGGGLLHGWRIGDPSGWLVRGTGGVERMAAAPAGGDDGRMLVFFLSPAVTRYDRSGREPVGDVLTMVASWRRRWLNHADPSHPLTAVIQERSADGRSALLQWCSERIELLDAGMRQRTWRAAGGWPCTGGVGWIDLRTHGGTGPERAALRALARFSLFCGTGGHLSFGFGQTLALVGAEADGVRRAPRQLTSWPVVHRRFASSVGSGSAKRSPAKSRRESAQDAKPTDSAREAVSEHRDEAQDVDGRVRKPVGARIARPEAGTAVFHERLAALTDLLSERPGMTVTEAAKRLGISNSYGSALARSLRDEGRLKPGRRLELA